MIFFVLLFILMARQPSSPPLEVLLAPFSLLALSIAILLDAKKKPISVHDAPTYAARGPKAFLKKCVSCDREIPIASEECPYCRTKQPDYVEP